MVSLYLIMVGLIFGFAMGLYVCEQSNKRRK
jgi:uncharacterized protein YneF (UPF0154 family)